MKIIGFEKLSLVDYPGKVSCILFCGGCNMRCPYCHNGELVLNPDLFPPFDDDEIFSYLEKRRRILDAVVISGGEPTLQSGLDEYISRIRDLGLLVKLDTNGLRVDVLKNLVDRKLVDYVAMDVKNSPVHYAETVGFGATNDASSKCNFEIQPIENSMSLLLQGTIPFEFRTAVLNELHTKDFLLETAHWIAGLANKNTYPLSNVAWFIQQFVDSETVFAGEGVFTPWNEDELRSLLPTLQAILPKTALRGV